MSLLARSFAKIAKADAPGEDVRAHTRVAELYKLGCAVMESTGADTPGEAMSIFRGRSTVHVAPPARSPRPSDDAAARRRRADLANADLVTRARAAHVQPRMLAHTEAHLAGLSVDAYARTKGLDLARLP